MNKAIIISLMLTLAMVASAQNDGQQPRLFNDALRKVYPSAVLDHVEQAYATFLGGKKDSSGRFDNIRFNRGSWQSLSQVNDSTYCTVEMLFGRLYTISWPGIVELEFPVQYDKILGGTRAEVEDRLIERLKTNDAEPSIKRIICTLSQLRDEDGLLVLDGETYQIADVNKNLYFIAESDTTKTDDLSIEEDEQPVKPKVGLVCDSLYPAQSVANIFIYGSRQSIPLTIVIPKHEYGEQETVETTVETLLQECEADGCEAYWGVEKVTDNELQGALFLYNRSLGYDHILRVTCDPRLIGSDKLTMQARMSLFVPNNNVKNLYHKDDPNASPKNIVYE